MAMFSQIKDWYHRNFSDPQVVILALLLLAGLVMIMVFGRMLAPVFASVVVAYLLEGLVARLVQFGVPRMISVMVVFSAFMAILLVLFFGITPMITRQLAQALAELPDYIGQIQTVIADLPQRYPQIVGEEQVNDILGRIGEDIRKYGGAVVSPSGVMYLIGLVIFLVLIPILVFFFRSGAGQRYPRPDRRGHPQIRRRRGIAFGRHVPDWPGDLPGPDSDSGVFLPEGQGADSGLVQALPAS